MPNVGPFEVIVVAIVALVVFGPKRLPELGSSMGKGIREFRASITGQDNDGERPEIDQGEQRPVERVEGEPCALTEVAELRRVRPDAYVQFDTCQDGGYRRYAGSASACDRREEREGVMVEAKETPPGGRQLRSALRKPTPGRHAGAKGCMATVRRATGRSA